MNHTPILVLSKRSLMPEVASEILKAWFKPYNENVGQEGVTDLLNLENSLNKNTSVEKSPLANSV